METCSVFLGTSHFFTMRFHVAIGTLIMPGRLLCNKGALDDFTEDDLVPLVRFGDRCEVGRSDNADSLEFCEFELRNPFDFKFG
jgi:hypothetical protein